MSRRAKSLRVEALGVRFCCDCASSRREFREGWEYRGGGRRGASVREVVMPGEFEWGSHTELKWLSGMIDEDQTCGGKCFRG
jgi:hypothetical protein